MELSKLSSDEFYDIRDAESKQCDECKHRDVYCNSKNAIRCRLCIDGGLSCTWDNFLSYYKHGQQQPVTPNPRGGRTRNDPPCSNCDALHAVGRQAVCESTVASRGEYCTLCRSQNRQDCSLSNAAPCRECRQRGMSYRIPQGYSNRGSIIILCGRCYSHFYGGGGGGGGDGGGGRGASSSQGAPAPPPASAAPQCRCGNPEAAAFRIPQGFPYAGQTAILCADCRAYYSRPLPGPSQYSNAQRVQQVRGQMRQPVSTLESNYYFKCRHPNRQAGTLRDGRPWLACPGCQTAYSL